jgi:glutamate-1-semialdehyde aminotransferase
MSGDVVLNDASVSITVSALNIYGNPVEVLQRLDQLAAAVSTLQATMVTQGAIQMATLDELLQDVSDESTQIDSLATLTAGLKQQLQDALSGANLPPAVQAKVDAVFAAVDANKGKVVDAINANTPAATPPTP